MLALIKQLEQLQLMNQEIKEHSLVIDHNHVTHGCIFFVKMQLKNYKIFIPTGFYEALLADGKMPTIKAVVNHKEAMLLK